MTNFEHLDWRGATVTWTEDGYRLSVPINGRAGPRHARELIHDLTYRLREYLDDGGDVAFDVSDGLLSLTSPSLLSSDAAALRASLDAAVRQAAATVNQQVEAEKVAIQGWLNDLRAAGS